jgi:hypothetical protein
MPAALWMLPFPVDEWKEKCSKLRGGEGSRDPETESHMASLNRYDSIELLDVAY